MTLAFRTLDTNVWFGGKPLKLGSETGVVADRLGTIRRGVGKDYFPYGMENAASQTAGDKEKYATYMQDGRTDLAYADQRYFGPGSGRFITADPLMVRQPANWTASPSTSQGWNSFTYGIGDPINMFDPLGLQAKEAQNCLEGLASAGSSGSGGGHGNITCQTIPRITTPPVTVTEPGPDPLDAIKAENPTSIPGATPGPTSPPPTGPSGTGGGPSIPPPAPPTPPETSLAAWEICATNAQEALRAEIAQKLPSFMAGGAAAGAVGGFVVGTFVSPGVGSAVGTCAGATIGTTSGIVILASAAKVIESLYALSFISQLGGRITGTCGPRPQ